MSERLAMIGADGPRLFAAFQAALSQGMTKEQVNVAMEALREEHRKWLGHPSWEESIAACVAAAFLAVANIK